MIGEQIKKARKAAGLSQKQLGEALDGRGISTISEWESGKRSPDVELLPIIADALGVSQAWLLGLPEDALNNEVKNHRIKTISKEDDSALDELITIINLLSVKNRGFAKSILLNLLDSQDK